jgi:hypothetical protein
MLLEDVMEPNTINIYFSVSLILYFFCVCFAIFRLNNHPNNHPNKDGKFIIFLSNLNVMKIINLLIIIISYVLCFYIDEFTDWHFILFCILVCYSIIIFVLSCVIQFCPVNEMLYDEILKRNPKDRLEYIECLLQLSNSQDYGSYCENKVNFYQTECTNMFNLNYDSIFDENNIKNKENLDFWYSFQYVSCEYYSQNQELSKSRKYEIFNILSVLRDLYNETYEQNKVLMHDLIDNGIQNKFIHVTKDMLYVIKDGLSAQNDMSQDFKAKVNEIEVSIKRMFTKPETELALYDAIQQYKNEYFECLNIFQNDLKNMNKCERKKNMTQRLANCKEDLTPTNIGILQMMFVILQEYSDVVLSNSFLCSFTRVENITRKIFELLNDVKYNQSFFHIFDIIREINKDIQGTAKYVGFLSSVDFRVYADFRNSLQEYLKITNKSQFFKLCRLREILLLHKKLVKIVNNVTKKRIIMLSACISLKIEDIVRKYDEIWKLLLKNEVQNFSKSKVQNLSFMMMKDMNEKKIYYLRILFDSDFYASEKELGEFLQGTSFYQNTNSFDFHAYEEYLKKQKFIDFLLRKLISIGSSVMSIFIIILIGSELYNDYETSPD